VRIIFCSKFGGTPHQESEDMIRKLEGTRSVQGCYVAKTKTQQMFRSQLNVVQSFHFREGKAPPRELRESAAFMIVGGEKSFIA